MINMLSFGANIEALMQLKASNTSPATWQTQSNFCNARNVIGQKFQAGASLRLASLLKSFTSFISYILVGNWEGGADALFDHIVSILLEISVLPSVSAKYCCKYAAQYFPKYCSSAMMLILLLPLILPSINSPLPLYFYSWFDIFQGNKSVERISYANVHAIAHIQKYI